jgi:hypothetical protein
MNATPHTVTSYVITRTIFYSIFTGNIFSFFGGLIASAIASFVSHIALDVVNESDGIKTTKQRIWLDIVPTIFLGIFSLIFGAYFGSEIFSSLGINIDYKVAASFGMIIEFILFLNGSFFGNLPDIIDKKGYLSNYDKNRYPYTFYFHIKGKPPINPSGQFTRSIGWVMVISCIILMTILF